MKIPNPIKAVGIAFIAVVCGLFLYWITDTAYALKLKHEDEAAFAAKCDQVQHDLPPGIPRSVAEAYAKEHQIPISTDGSSELLLNLQHIHSAEWYCSSWVGQLHLGFAYNGNDVTRTYAKRSEFGDNCL